MSTSFWATYPRSKGCSTEFAEFLSQNTLWQSRNRSVLRLHPSLQKKLKVFKQYPVSMITFTDLNLECCTVDFLVSGLCVLYPSDASA